MTGRRIYMLIFSLLIVGAYTAVFFFFRPLDNLQYISLLFTTIAVSLVYFLPIALPKSGKAYAMTTFKLYFVTILYAACEVVVSYMFSFTYSLDGSQSLFGLPIDESFYFLANTAALFIVLIIVFFMASTPKSLRKKPDDGYQYSDDPTPVTPVAPAPEAPAAPVLEESPVETNDSTDTPNQQ